MFWQMNICLACLENSTFHIREITFCPLLIFSMSHRNVNLVCSGARLAGVLAWRKWHSQLSWHVAKSIRANGGANCRRCPEPAIVVSEPPRPTGYELSSTQSLSFHCSRSSKRFQICRWLFLRERCKKI